jgi:hypothetical protein
MLTSILWFCQQLAAQQQTALTVSGILFHAPAPHMVPQL